MQEQIEINFSGRQFIKVDASGHKKPNKLWEIFQVESKNVLKFQLTCPPLSIFKSIELTAVYENQQTTFILKTV